MKIQYASDLHIEFPENRDYLKRNPLKSDAKFLVLAGDIVPFKDLNKYFDFFRYCADNYEFTYWISGKHEYYHSDICEHIGSFVESIFPNVFLINNSKLIYEKTTFLFSTLWSYIRPINELEVKSILNDFHLITFNGSKLKTNVFNQLHNDSYDFLKQELSNIKTEKTIVVMHPVPTKMNYPAKYKNSTINDAFVVELFDLIESTRPDVWIYGHSHCNTKDFEIGKSKMLTKQLGYVNNNEHKEFKNQICFSI